MARTFPKFGYNPVTGEWNDSLAGEFLWSNVNVSEAVPDVMTPSTWSLWWIFHYETNPINFPGDHPLCGNLCGRPYINLSLLASLYRALGRDYREELQGDMIGSAPAEVDLPIIPLSAVQVYRAILPGAIQSHWRASRDQRKISDFLTTMPAWCRNTRAAILNCPNASAMLSLWCESIRPLIVRACRMLRSVTMILAEPGTKLHLELNDLVGEAEANALLSNLSGAAGNLESLGPLMGLAKVQNGEMSREEYMQCFGHRGPHEMELFAPGSDDDPAWFEKQWADFNNSAMDVNALLARQRDETLAAWERFETRFPHKIKPARRAADKVAKAARDREAVRSEVTRLTRLLRQFLLRAGELTGLGDGIFFLSLDETSEVLAGERLCTSHIPARRDMYMKYSCLPPYPAIIVGHFNPFHWVADPHRRRDYFDSRSSSVITSNTIKGFAGAPGRIEGIVRRVDCIEAGNQIQPGEVLVTVTTNVGWTLLFPRLAAIVTDVGAPLSHAAIVAREMGIPAVVGCGNATMLLKTGDHIRVDGGRGMVEILKQSLERS